MFRAALLLGLAAFAAVPSAAQARDGCGPGWYHNGYACVPQRGPGYSPGYGPGPGYGPPPPPPGYYGGGGGYGPQPRSRANPDCYPYHGRWICCPRNWTVQDGVCKPYTGR